MNEQKSLSLGKSASLIRRVLDKFLLKCGYLRIKLPQDGGRRLAQFSDVDLLKAVIGNTVFKKLDMKSPAKEELLADLVNEIHAGILKTESLSIYEQLTEMHPEILRDRMMLSVLGCGIIAYWELLVKSCAQVLNLDIYCEQEYEGQKFFVFKKLDDVVELVTSALPGLSLNLGTLRKLRNELLHGNFHRLHTLFVNLKPKKYRAKYEGQVWKMSPTGAFETKRMSEIELFNEIKANGLFGWFLNAATSPMFEELILMFKSSCEALHHVIAFKAVCYDELKPMFSKLCVQGAALKKNEIDQIKTARAVVQKYPGEFDKMFEVLHAVKCR